MKNMKRILILLILLIPFNVFALLIPLIESQSLVSKSIYIIKIRIE